MTEQERAELCVTSYRKIVFDERNSLEIINEFAEEYDCEQIVKNNVRYKEGWQVCCQLDYSEQFNNQCGNEVTIAYRLSSGGSIVMFIIENSYKRLKDINQDMIQDMIGFEETWESLKKI